jgi:predicted RNase H-like nuclease (RuvC/YqgF family)
MFYFGNEITSICRAFESFTSNYEVYYQVHNQIKANIIDKWGIQNSLDKILEKVKSLHGALLNERKTNSDLENEIQQLRATNLEKTNQVFSLETEVETLRSALHLAQNKVVEVPVQVVGKREEEIDELVREIEHCIEQLKQ